MEACVTGVASRWQRSSAGLPEGSRHRRGLARRWRAWRAPPHGDAPPQDSYEPITVSLKAVTLSVLRRSMKPGMGAIVAGALDAEFDSST